MTGRKLKEIRLDTLDMTQEELGKAIGVTRGTVLLYEQGKLRITRTVELAVLYLVKHGSRRR